ncbi:MAG: hypothetical protein IT340_04735 [Chloroflexi bacterium]|nr:hypothetical protein [Chloroflexota bacterium]
MIGLGGAAYVVGALLAAQFAATLLGEGRLLAGEEAGLLAVSIGLGISSLAGLVVTGLARFSAARRWAIVGVWLLTFVGLWGLSRVLGQITLPAFVVVLTGVGIFGGVLIAPRTASRPARRVASRPVGRSSAVIDSRQYGRVLPATVVLLTSQVAQVRNEVAAALTGAPPVLVSATEGAVLERTLHDWWENGNLAGLQPRDIDDLKGFVTLAGALAGSLDDPLGQAIYRAALGALLDDWLVRWNADGIDGPPRRA